MIRFTKGLATLVATSLLATLFMASPGVAADDIEYPDDGGTVSLEESPSAETTDTAEVTFAGRVYTPEGSYVNRYHEDCINDDGGWFYGSHSECARIAWRDWGDASDHRGMDIRTITLSCRGLFNNPALDGKGLSLRNDANDIKVFYDSVQSNVQENCYKEFTINTNFYLTSYMRLTFRYRPKYEAQPDPANDRVIAFYIYA